MELGKIHTQLLKLKSWREFTRLCDNLLTDPSGRKQAGNLFEELTRLYLLTTSEHATKIKAVWHHSEIPTKLLNQLGLVRPEIGVDLLVELKNGRYWAVQAKYRSDFTKNLPLSALSGFQAIAARQLKHSKDFSHWIVATSNYDLSTKAYSLFPKMGLIGFADFSALAENEFKAIHEYIRRGRVKPKPFKPRKHQKQAVKAVSEFFTDNSATRGKIIHPCGSGKSLTGFWISQALKSRSVLIAVPSLALVRQILRDWTRECLANGIDVDWMAVCSDEGVKDSDDTSTKTADLGIEVDTDPKVVAKFLSKKSRTLKVIVTTYQSGQVVIDAAKKSKAKFDLGIFDEAHKTVGIVGKKWGKLLRDENVKVARRIFMTATEKQYRGNSEQFDSMDDEAFYGPIIHQLSFKAALEQKPPILSDYKIVTTIVTSSQIAELIRNNTFVRSSGKDWSTENDAIFFASMVALQKLFRKYKTKHAVSFHSSIKRASEFMELMNQVSKGRGKISSFHVSGKDSTGARSGTMQDFLDAPKSLVTNARCLTEGVDVPAIDVVLFADPKRSKIDIVQAAGRAMRRFEGKEFGYILIPIILENLSKSSIEKSFNDLISVIVALATQDERIIEELKARARGKKTLTKIMQYEPVYANVENNLSIKELLSSIEIKVWEKLECGWAYGYTRLLMFHNANGHARPSTKYIDESGFWLGEWTGRQRFLFRSGELLSDRVEMLENLNGWTWDPREDSWYELLSRIKKFYSNRPLDKISTNYKNSDGYRLGTAVLRIRHQFRQNQLTDDQIAELEEVEFWNWDFRSEYFFIGKHHYLKYCMANDKAPRGLAKTKCGFNLGNWVNWVRRNLDNSDFRSKFEAEINELPFWENQPLLQHYLFLADECRAFYKKNGHLRPDRKVLTKNGKNLNTMVLNLRRRILTQALEKEILNLFQGLPILLSEENQLEKHKIALYHLKKYYAINGTYNVPGTYINDAGFKLGAYVIKIRNQNKSGKLTSDVSKMFEDLKNFSWDPFTDKFNDNFKLLHEYYLKNKTSKIKRKKTEYQKIYLWCKYVRKKYRKGQLTKPQITLFDNFHDWEWNPVQAREQYAIQCLKEFAREFGHSKVPLRYISHCKFPLGTWANSKKMDKRKGLLSKELTRVLEDMPGWDWGKRKAKVYT